MRHFLLLTSDTNGVLARITAVVSSAGINIDVASAFPAGDAGLSIVHLRLSADEIQADRIRRKLARLVDVLEIREGNPAANDFGLNGLFSCEPDVSFGEPTVYPALKK